MRNKYGQSSLSIAAESKKTKVIKKLFESGLNDVKKGKIKALSFPVFHQGAVSDLQFSKDGSLIISAGYKSAKVWTNSGIALVRSKPAWMTSVAITTDNALLLTADNQGENNLVTIKNRKIISFARKTEQKDEIPQNDEMNILNFSSDNRLILGCDARHACSLWDLKINDILEISGASCSSNQNVFSLILVF